MFIEIYLLLITIISDTKYPISRVKKFLLLDRKMTFASKYLGLIDDLNWLIDPVASITAVAVFSAHISKLSRLFSTLRVDKATLRRAQWSVSLKTSFLSLYFSLSLSFFFHLSSRFSLSFHLRSIWSLLNRRVACRGTEVDLRRSGLKPRDWKSIFDVATE